ncbi:MAG: DUF389 domain-containing protein, partial [Myxococcales bacterium]
LLPLTAGAAGALNLCQSERNSLVSGAATGLLVAASLAPPAGLLGMAAALGDPAPALNAAFVILLQLVGINVSGAAVFRAYGLSPRGARYSRGKPAVAWAAWLVSLGAATALVAVQVGGGPRLQRSSRELRAQASIRAEVSASGLGEVVHSEVRFTGERVGGHDLLLAEVFVRLRPETAEREAREALAHRLRERLRRDGAQVEPLVSVTPFTVAARP